jgi:hypothetical protein
LIDGELRLLAKLCELAWSGEPDHKTPALHWREFVTILEVSKATFFRNIRSLELAGYLSREELGDRVRYAILTHENERASSTDSSLVESVNTLSSSRSHSLTGENELFDLLKEAGIGEPLRSELANDPEITEEYVRAHIRYAELKHDPVRLLAHRLKVRDPEPSDRELAELDPNSDEARGRYLQGRFKDYVD